MHILWESAVKSTAFNHCIKKPENRIIVNCFSFGNCGVKKIHVSICVKNKHTAKERNFLKICQFYFFHYDFLS